MKIETTELTKSLSLSTRDVKNEHQPIETKGRQDKSFNEVLNDKSKQKEKPVDVKSKDKPESKVDNIPEKKVDSSGKLENNEVDTDKNEITEKDLEKILALIESLITSKGITSADITKKIEGIIPEGELLSKLEGILESLLKGSKSEGTLDLSNTDKSNLLEQINEMLDPENTGKKDFLNFLNNLQSAIKETKGNDFNLVDYLKSKVEGEAVELPSFTQTETTTSEGSGEGAGNLASNKEDEFLDSLLSKKDSKIDDSKIISPFSKFTVESFEGKAPTVKPSIMTKENAVMDIVKTMKFMGNESVQEITLKVVPRNLGEVVISLIKENGSMKATITATNPEAYNMLSAKIEELNSQLNSLKVHNLEITYMNNADYSGKGNDKGENESNANKTNSNGVIDGVEAEEAVNVTMDDVVSQGISELA